VYWKHEEVLNLAKHSDSHESRENSHIIDEIHAAEDQSSNEDEDELEEQIINESYSDDKLQHSAAMFLLKTQEEHKVTQLALNEIVQGVQGLWEDAIQNLKV